MSGTSVNETDRVQIIDVIHRYFWLVDHGQANEVYKLFSTDGRLEFGAGAPQLGTLQGPEIAASMLARAQLTHVTTRHIVSNIMLRGREDSVIESYSLLTLFRSDDKNRDSYPRSVADVEDMFVRLNGDWRIQKRVISPIFNRS